MNINNDNVCYKFKNHVFIAESNSGWREMYLCPYPMLGYVLNNNFTIIKSNDAVTLKEKDFFFLPAHHTLMHVKSYNDENSRFKGLFIFFHPSLSKYFNRLIGQWEFPDKMLYWNSSNTLDNVVGSIMDYIKDANVLTSNIITLKQLELLNLLSGIIKPASEIRLIDILDKSKDNISLKRMSEIAGLSMTSFKRKFRQENSCTPHQYLLDRRLCEAAALLEQGLSPSDVYLEFGFKSLSHFSCSFKRKFGMSPRSFIDKNRLLD